MDSAELLDLLGNANRRRILRLLAQKPCYVTEISEYLKVSPKAVIDHLRKLEDAGLVENRVDDQRRKYFSISRNLRLEVRLSPYEFGTKSAYAANRGVDMTTCRYLSLSVEMEDGQELPAMAETLAELEDLENELSLAQRWVQGRIGEVRDEIAAAVEGVDPRLAGPVLAALADGGQDLETLAADVEAPPEVVQEVLEALVTEGVVRRDERGWRLNE